MKIGIYLKGENIPERFNKIAQSIIRKNKELIIKLNIERNPNSCFIETTDNTYLAIRLHPSAIGRRVYKAYYTKDATQDELNDIIIPAISISRIPKPIEMIEEDDN